MTFQKFLRTSLALSLTLGLAACSSSPTSEDVDQEVAEQPARTFHGGVAAKGMEAINDSKSLSSDQKDQLKKLHMKMAEETMEIQTEMSKVKGVLFETITSKPYKPKKVAELKKRLLSLNDKKMKNMIQALDKTEKILGENHSPEELKGIYEHMLDQGTH
ncbi:MAG TPA: hypothetical protein DCL41_09615 [Bdellovibrionales bacterium]|nr:hypothetical protein [Pseudobdellovibrionaceae bacterium]HAG92119.1 hypothetical protein [Bdellovibrionales bacterium]|tara:strand:- start:163 stop:642 length:480 start_codon:yes stop_codon:yes gene_type:complete